MDRDVVYGEPVFAGTRMSVEDAVKNYYAFRDLDGLSDQEAVKATLDSCRTIPAAEALRAVLAYEASREHLLQP